MIINYLHLKTLRDAAQRERQGKPVSSGEMKPLWRTLVAVTAAVVLILGGLIAIATLASG